MTNAGNAASVTGPAMSTGDVHPCEQNSAPTPLLRYHRWPVPQTLGLALAEPANDVAKTTPCLSGKLSQIAPPNPSSFVQDPTPSFRSGSISVATAGLIGCH